MRRILLTLLLICITFVLMSLDYEIPPHSQSICSGDLNGDGDNDIVIAHYINSNETMTFLYNNCEW
jgi:hypothetical protein